MKKIILGILFSLLVHTSVMAQTFSARVNRDTIPEGETFLLTLELDGKNASTSPDFKALEKDFYIYSVSNAYQTNIVNGDVKKSQQWNLVMMPKTVGNLVVPSLTLDKLQSNPINLKVVKAGETISPQQTNDQGQNRPRFKISGKVDDNTPYVQQQITYTLTLNDTGGLQGEEPVFLASPDSPWIIKSLGAPVISSQIVNGKSIREIEFKYALFPQKSGILEVPAVRFNGYYLTKEKRTDPFGSFFNDDLFIAGFGMADVFATRNPVVLTTDPITVDVKPAAPENNGRWWLPAENVKLYAEFTPSQKEYRVGEAINRTLYLTAAGVTDTQLPEINFAPADGLKQYPEKPQSLMKVQKGKVLAVEKIATVYIPEKAGAVTLPEISVDWFNVQTKKMQTATLPAVTLNITPADTVNNPVLPSQSQDENLYVHDGGDEPSPSQPNEPKEITALEHLNDFNIYVLLLGAFALGIAFSYLLMKSNDHKAHEPHIRNYKKYIIEKAKAKDLRALRDGLLEWARKHFQNDNIATLKDIEDLVKLPEFECEIEKLTESLYARDNKDWNEKSFIKVFEKVCKKKVQRKKNDELLPKLYK